MLNAQIFPFARNNDNFRYMLHFWKSKLKGYSRFSVNAIYSHELVGYIIMYNSDTAKEVRFGL